MTRKKWIILGIKVLAVLLMLAVGVFFKKNLVSIGNEHRLSELNEDEAVLVLEWSKSQAGDVIVVNKCGKWKTVNVVDWMGDDWDINYYISCDVECWDGILQDDSIPYQKSKLPLYPYYLKRAINISPFRWKLQDVQGCFVAAPLVVSYYAVCYDDRERRSQMLGMAGDIHQTQWDIRLLGMRAALDKLDREREKLED